MLCIWTRHEEHMTNRQSLKTWDENVLHMQQRAMVIDFFFYCHFKETGSSHATFLDLCGRKDITLSAAFAANATLLRV